MGFSSTMLFVQDRYHRLLYLHLHLYKHGISEDRVWCSSEMRMY
jgi:hypothetical protein